MPTFVALLLAVEGIVSLSPNATEILHGIGAFDRVVAVSTYCEYPPEVAQLPRVGGWTNTNLEQVLVLDPDLVILSDAQTPSRLLIFDNLFSHPGVPPRECLAGFYEAIDTI